MPYATLLWWVTKGKYKTVLIPYPLPEEQDILSRLIGCKQSEYIEVPITDERLGLQVHHLYVSETWVTAIFEFSINVHIFAASLILNSQQNGFIRTSKGVQDTPENP